MNKILAHFRNKFPVGDWRRPLYDDDKWKAATLLRDFTARKQHVTLPAGTEVAAQRDEDGRVIILHPSLLGQTSLGHNILKGL